MGLLLLQLQTVEYRVAVAHNPAKICVSGTGGWMAEALVYNVYDTFELQVSEPMNDPAGISMNGTTALIQQEFLYIGLMNSLIFSLLIG